METTILGGGNLIKGGSGDDRILYNDGSDTVYGGSGNDQIDYIYPYDEDLGGATGTKWLYGGAGNDYISSASVGFLDGGSGNDYLVLNVRGTAYGRAGNDGLIGSTSGDLLDGGSNDDQLDGNAGSDTLKGGVGNDTILGGQYYIYGRYLLYSSGGNDLIDGGNGADLLYGGQNTDEYIYEEFGFADSDTDTLYGGAGHDTLYGEDGGDRLEGNGGNDLIYGGGTVDFLEIDYGYGDDYIEIVNVDGADTLLGGLGDDTLDGRIGNDILVGVDPDVLSPGQGEKDVLIGGGDSDWFVLGDATTTFYDDNATTYSEGRLGYATLKDLTLGVDTIQLHGTPDNYSLEEVNGSTQIFEASDLLKELIGIAEGVVGLDLNDTTQFTFV
ncbi:MAG: calcium-binding protein [Oscillatoriales cyanobacterium RM1_1_9]|nr:calcium-binding protein [Oscillatoriales cyanobacterium RM1_1_9]